VRDETLVLTAAPGEANAIVVAAAGAVTDAGAPLTAGPGCARQGGGVVCPGALRLDAQLGDGDDSLALATALPAEVAGGAGNDSLRGGGGSDTLIGGDGDDAIDGGSGRDWVDGGAGADMLALRDRASDTAACGGERDGVRADLRDALDYECERIDLGAPGSVGRVRRLNGGGRFVPVPGQPWTRVDRRILPAVEYLIRRYHVEFGDGLATEGHEPFGEHPLGLAVDVYPGPGGSWAEVARLARWAEPRQNRPRAPFRWVGWNGDFNHGDPQHCRLDRGCPAHLHLSWSHSPGRPLHPVRRVWTFEVAK
jgi:hypothetical protein